MSDTQARIADQINAEAGVSHVPPRQFDDVALKIVFGELVSQNSGWGMGVASGQTAISGLSPTFLLRAENKYSTRSPSYWWEREPFWIWYPWISAYPTLPNMTYTNQHGPISIWPWLKKAVITKMAAW